MHCVDHSPHHYPSTISLFSVTIRQYVYFICFVFFFSCALFSLLFSCSIIVLIILHSILLVKQTHKHTRTQTQRMTEIQCDILNVSVSNYKWHFYTKSRDRTCCTRSLLLLTYEFRAALFNSYTFCLFGKQFKLFPSFPLCLVLVFYVCMCVCAFVCYFVRLCAASKNIFVSLQKLIRIERIPIIEFLSFSHMGIKEKEREE